MFRRILICSVAFLLSVSCQKKPHEGVAVIVNGYEIMRPEIMQTAEMLRQSMISAFPEKAVEGLTNEHLAGAAHQLVANRLLIEEAKKRGITAVPAAVDSGYKVIQKRFPDKAAFERELTKMGETESSFKEKIADGLCLDSLMSQVLLNTRSIDTEECRAFYEKNKDKYRGIARMRVSQIFLPFTEKMSDADRQKLADKAADILRQLKAGKEFETLAKKYSSGPGVEQGGDLGWFKKGDLRQDLETPLLPLAKGDISNVVTTSVGLHILRKSDEEPETQLPFEDAEKRIRLVLEIKARNELVSAYLDSLTSKAKVVYVDSTLSQTPSFDPNFLPQPTAE